jgi:hypothetical protein
MTGPEARRALPAAVIVAIAVVLSLPALIPLLAHNGCDELVLRSAVRDKSHYHHIDSLDPARSARSIRVRECITKARNRIFLSAVELTPVVVGAVWYLFVRPRAPDG